MELLYIELKKKILVASMVMLLPNKTVFLLNCIVMAMLEELGLQPLFKARKKKKKQIDFDLQTSQ